MRANRADARDGRPHRQTVPSRCRTSLIAPIRPLRCHSHPESANALFSTLGVRVQAGRQHPAGEQDRCATGRMTRSPRRAAGHPACSQRLTWSVANFVCGLDCADRDRLRPTVALLDVELNSLAFFKAAVAIRLDGGEVDEDVPATVDRDEAVALVRVEPFDGALSHYSTTPNYARAFGIPPLLFGIQ